MLSITAQGQFEVSSFRMEKDVMAEVNIEVLDTVGAAKSLMSDVSALFEDAYDRELSMASWRQYYFENPFGAPIISVARSASLKIVGHFALVPQMLTSTSGRSFPYVLSITTMVHPLFRNVTTLFSLVDRAVEVARTKGFQFILGFPNRNAYLPFTRLFNWKLLWDTPLYNWVPVRGSAVARVDCLNSLRLADDISVPCDETYRCWRSALTEYSAVCVNGRLRLVYKLLPDGTLNVLDAVASDTHKGTSDLAGLAFHVQAPSVRLTGTHAEILGLSSDQLKKHDDYDIRLCGFPLSEDIPSFRPSLLMSDVF